MNVKKLSTSLRAIHSGFSNVVKQTNALERQSQQLTAEFEVIAAGVTSLAVADIPDAGQQAKQVYADIEMAMEKLSGVIDRMGQMQVKAGAIAGHSMEGAALTAGVRDRSKLVAGEAAQLTVQLASRATIAGGVMEMIAGTPEERTKMLELIGREAIEGWLNEGQS